MKTTLKKDNFKYEDNLKNEDDLKNERHTSLSNAAKVHLMAPLDFWQKFTPFLLRQFSGTKNGDYL